MTLLLPESGSAATTFFSTFGDEAIGRWIPDIVTPGMCVIDVGAHIGVYSLLAARLVGSSGVVHAIDPQCSMLKLLAENAELNGLSNVTTHCLALGEADGEAGLRVMSSNGAFTIPGEAEGSARVPVQTMETFATSLGRSDLGLVKVDAAGNELAVLRGAAPLLERGAVRTLICKLYHPRVVEERFGAVGGPSAIVTLLRSHGFQTDLPDDHAADEAALGSAFADGSYCIPLVARR
jgi:FkbM family methyltransferase